MFLEIWLQWYTTGVVMSRELFIGVYFVFALSAVAASLASFWYVLEPFKTFYLRTSNANQTLTFGYFR